MGEEEVGFQAAGGPLRTAWPGDGGEGVGLSPGQPHGQRPHHVDTPALAWPMDLGHHYTTAGYQELHSLKKKKKTCF